MARPTPIKSALEHFAPHAAKPQPEGPIRVRATRTGFYGHSLRHPGDEFTIQSEKELGSWMVRVDEVVSESATAPGAPSITPPAPSTPSTPPADPNQKTGDDVL